MLPHTHMNFVISLFVYIHLLLIFCVKLLLRGWNLQLKNFHCTQYLSIEKKVILQGIAQTWLKVKDPVFRYEYGRSSKNSSWVIISHYLIDQTRWRNSSCIFSKSKVNIWIESWAISIYKIVEEHDYIQALNIIYKNYMSYCVNKWEKREAMKSVLYYFTENLKILLTTNESTNCNPHYIQRTQ